MSSELAVVQEVPITLEDVKKYIAPKATDKELFMFMGIAKAYGLNPMKREIHFVKYGDAPASIIVGYESYLKRAERTGKLDGWKCWIEADKIGEKAVIEIYRKDRREPVKWEVYRKEFDRQQSTWKAMPTFMLKKVAIAQGFRLAFPEEIGGMPYVPEELPQTKDISSEQLPKATIEDVNEFEDITPPETKQTQHEPTSQATDSKISPSQKKLEALLSSEGIDREDFKKWLFSIEYLNKNSEGKLSMKDLQPKHLKVLIDKWDGAKTKFSLWQDEKNKATS